MRKFLLLGGILLAWMNLPVLTAHGALDETGAWAEVPVLSGGRLMPMDTLARQKLLLYSGRSRHERKPAARWMARLLFAPEVAREDEIFLVNHPEVAEALGLPAEGRRRYSFAHLEPLRPRLRQQAAAVHKLEEASRTPVEKEIFRLYTSLVDYVQLQDAGSLLRPHPELVISSEALKKDLGLPADTRLVRPLDLFERWETLEKLTLDRRNVPRGEWTDYERELLQLGITLSSLQARAGQAGPAMIPLPGHGPEAWVTPWEAVDAARQHPVVRAELQALGRMAEAFAAGAPTDFDLAATGLIQDVSSDLAPDAVRRLKLEVRFNRSKVFYRAEMMYGFAFLAVLVSLMVARRSLTWAAVLLIAVGLVAHTYGIWARMIIMQRPPVTNLYSTFVFVAWCSVLLGLVVEWAQRSRLGLLTAAASGLALLLTAGRFSVEGDTMGVMVAVLDSNFWLATHVVTITMGYAGCCMAGLVGHIYLFQALQLPARDRRLVETFRTMYGTLAFGLIFSFIGTMLGGVWADQSWGRFWGWDPKENGALVIVLWSAILFHARLAKMIGPRGFAAGSVIGVIWVMLAWLGVNLLGVGLHSYGFTSSLARGLMITCGAELAFLAVMGLLGLRRRPSEPAPAV